MLIVTITGKPFPVSLLRDNRESRSESLGDGICVLQYFCSCGQAEKALATGSGFKDNQSRTEIYFFGITARCFLRLLCSPEGDAGLGSPSVLSLGQGPQVEGVLTGVPMFGSCGLSQLPSPVTASRSKTVPEREAEVRRKGVGAGVLQGLERKPGLAASRALQVFNMGFF